MLVDRPHNFPLHILTPFLEIRLSPVANRFKTTKKSTGRKPLCCHNVNLSADAHLINSSLHISSDYHFFSEVSFGPGRC